MRFKQQKIRNGPETTPINHPNFSTLPQTRLTSVYQNFLLWNTTATEYQPGDESR